MRSARNTTLLFLLGAATLSACGGDPEPSGSGGSGTTTSSTSTTSVGGEGGSTGGGGAGGTGGGGGSTCTPGSTKSCYSGPATTEGVGLCKAGTQTCKANGEGYGPCEGEVLPAVEELCATPGDDDCDGMTNEGGPDCSCVPGTVKSCYSGPPDTENVGACVGGSQVCNDDGQGYGPCDGEITPILETCETLVDDDCDGLTNEEGTLCVCPPDAMVDCYSGPAGTENVGDCKAGKALCNSDGTVLGPCEGQVTPAAETCLAAGDEDCDGTANEEGAGCTCTPGTMVPCYTGPMGTLGIGLCKGGMQTCGPQGMPEGACVGEVVPIAETCATPGDDDCDGQSNEDGVGCSCVPGSTKSCYSGPAGTEGVGACKAGTQTCLAGGMSYGPCTGEVLPQAENCNTPANEDCTMTVDCGTSFWAKAFGTTGDQVANAIARDPQNNAVFTGRFTGQMSFGGGLLVSPVGNDIFVSKFDTAGNFLWARRFGDASVYQEGFDIATDASGNVFVTGFFDGSINFGGGGFTSGGLTDVFLVKLDVDGNHLWSKAFPAPSPQYGASLAVDSQGNVVLLANGFNTVDFGGGGLASAGNYDIYLAKFDGVTGGHLWSKRYGSPNDDRGTAVAVDSANNVVFTGRSDAALDFGGGSVPSNGGMDVLLVKVDANGGFVWAKRYGDGANQFGADLAIDASNNVIVAGGFEGSVNFGGGALSAQGPIDAFVAKVTPAGNHVWSKRYGAGGVNLSLLGVHVDSIGDVTAVGSLDGTVDFGGGVLASNAGADALVLHLGSANGNLLWSRLYGGPGAQYISSVVPDSSRNLLLCGYFEQTIDFGGGPLTSQGALDILLAKVAP